MAQTPKTTVSTEMNVTAEQLAAAIATATFEAAQRATKREIDDPTPVNAIGVPRSKMPALKYKEALFCGAPQDVNRATADEVRLFNEITVPGFYGPDKSWEVRIKDEKLHVVIHGINRREVRMELPRSLKEILQTIVDEQNAVAA
jgi:hypothetical protein